MNLVPLSCLFMPELNSLYSEDAVRSLLTGRHSCENPLMIQTKNKQTNKNQNREESASTHNLELQRTQIRTLQPRAVCGITKPAPSAHAEEQEGYWVPTVYTFLCNCLYQTVQPRVSTDCHEGKRSSCERTTRLCAHSFAEKSSKSKY